MYIIKARYYSEADQLGESFVITSDNKEKDMKLEVGTKVKIVAICTNENMKNDIPKQLLFNFTDMS